VIRTVRNLFCLIAIATIAACSAPANAFAVHGGNAAAVLCAQGTGDPNDGCVASPSGGQFQDVSFFTSARQTGQSAYATRPAWNVAGVDYPVGLSTPLASHAQSSTINSTNHPGCSSNLFGYANMVECDPVVTTVVGSISSGSTAFTISSGTTTGIAAGQILAMYCNGCNHPAIVSGSGNNWILDQAPKKNGVNVAYSGASIEVDIPIDIEGFDFADGFLYIPNGNTTLKFINNALHRSAVSCQLLGGNGLTAINSADLDAESNQIYLDPSCSHHPNLYGTTIDPGLQTQSTAVGSVTAGVFTPTSVAGTMSISQYISFPGQVNTHQIISFGNTDKTCTGTACLTETMNLAIGPCPFGCSVDTALGVSGGTAFSTGPAQTASGTVFGGGFDVKLRYNVEIGLTDLVATSGSGNVDEKFDYVLESPAAPEHNDGIQQIPSPCLTSCSSANATTLASFTQSYSTYWQDKYTAPGYTTAMQAQFSTSNTANKPSPNGYQITYALLQSDHNTLVSNTMQNSGTLVSNGGVTAGINVSSMIQTQGQGSNYNQFTASFSDNGGGTSTMHVTAVAVGTLANGQQAQICAYPGCPIPMVMTQITTQGADTSTWSVPVDLTLGSGLVYSALYTGIATVVNWTTNYGDAHGFSHCLLQDPSTIIGTLNISGNVNMSDGSTMTQSVCVH
jgi:hypothetical protein